MEIHFTPKYERALLKLVKRRQEYLTIVEKRVSILKHSHTHPQLRLHKLSNRKDEYAISVDHSIRIIFSRDKDTCYLLDIGPHDDVY